MVNCSATWVHMTNFILHMTYLMGTTERTIDEYAYMWQIPSTYDKFDGKMDLIQ